MPRRRRLISPVGFFLVLMCFGLPFVAVSCESPMMSITAEYTGGDLVVSGKPDVTVSGQGSEMPPSEEIKPIDVQPLAILAVLAVLAGIAIGLVPRLQARSGASAAVGGIATLFLIANQILVHSDIVSELEKSGEIPAGTVDDIVESRVGFWLALLCLLAVVGYNVFEFVRERRTLAPAGLPWPDGDAPPAPGSQHPPVTPPDTAPPNTPTA